MAKGKTAKQPTGKGVSKKRKPAIPPKDNPLLRHEELSVDRRIEGEDPPIEEEAVLMAAPAAKKAAKVMKAKATMTGSDVSKLAELRIAAMGESKTMEAESAGHARASGVAPAPGAEEIDTTPPAAGISNWVQMGPTVIPKGQTYSPSRVNVTGRITAIVVDPTNPNIIYIGTAQGGVWKTTDGGANWVATSDNEMSLAIGAVAMDPGNHLVLYAGTGEGNFSGDSYYGNGVLKTTNGGASWTNLAQPTFTGKRFSRIAVTPGTTTRLFAAVGDGIYRSTDSGVTWTKMTNGIPAGMGTDVSIDSATPTTVYAAIWGSGIYKTTNASAANPSWTKLTSGLPASGFTRIALSVSPSSPLTVYALFADGSYTINGFYRTTNGGTSWTNIPLPGGNIGGQGFYNLNVAVDPTTPDIVYLSGISVWKATRNAATGVWTISNVAATIHPDNHAFAFHPTNHLIVYAGNDGGIYKSTDGGATWTDTINEGPCITQYEFIDQHPTSDAVVFGGTQDNGTEQFRNSPVFYHADDGDGGYCAVDRNQPKNVISTYYGNSPKRSTQGGKFGTWMSVSAGILGSGLFYPPMALDDTNPNNVAFGTDRINLDPTQGAGGWTTKVTLPGITGVVSAIHYVNSNLIYAGTSSGKVYRLVKSAGTWTATAIHAAPLPSQFIWDVAARPDNPNIVIVAMSGFGSAHVWRGTVPAAGVATWADVSGVAPSRLPDIPVNALVIDPGAPNTYYIGTDIGIFRTTNAGTAWSPFSEGLPNCAVFDMRMHTSTRLLRAATHGRGLWERKLDIPTLPNADIFFRDNLMDTGRFQPSPSGVAAAFEDPLQFVTLGNPVWHWQCADIKVDALEGSPPSYQMLVSSVDYVAYESKLQHRNAQRGKVNRVYVQVHNRGFAPATNVTVKLLYANASAGLPPLQPNFWTAFPGNPSGGQWIPIGAAKVIPSLSPVEPVILEWDWSTPLTAADHSCLLVVMDSSSNPIPAANKIFDVNSLIRLEKRVGLKNLHVVNAPPGTFAFFTWSLFSASSKAQAIRVLPTKARGWSINLMMPKTLTVGAPAHPNAASKKSSKKAAAAVAPLVAFTIKKPTAKMLQAFKGRFEEVLNDYDTTRLYNLKDLSAGGTISGLKVPKRGLQAIVVIEADAGAEKEATFDIIQQEGETIIGGNTFILRAAKSEG